MWLTKVIERFTVESKYKTTLNMFDQIGTELVQSNLNFEKIL